jgi:hypothetical protein
MQDLHGSLKWNPTAFIRPVLSGHSGCCTSLESDWVSHKHTLPLGVFLALMVNICDATDKPKPEQQLFSPVDE